MGARCGWAAKTDAISLLRRQPAQERVRDPGPHQAATIAAVRHNAAYRRKAALQEDEGAAERGVGPRHRRNLPIFTGGPGSPIRHQPPDNAA
jgi:hypothetical protein